ncbi:alpha-hydroxy acid oxidase [Burkholderia sp. MR1-5-21]
MSSDVYGSNQNYEWFRAKAKRRLPKGIFEYIDRGAEDEVALAYNRRQFESIKLLPRVLNDVSTRSLKTTVFGREQSMPTIVSPTACAGLGWYKGEIELAKAAAQTGIPFCAATEAITSVEEIADTAKGNVWFQLYVWEDRKLTLELLDRAMGAGVETLVVTSDTAVYPKREYNYKNGFDMPMRYTLPAILDILRHPGWLFGVLARYWMSEGMPANANYPAEFRNTIIKAKADQRVNITPSLNWEDISQLRRYWKGNLIIKGVLHPETALAAASSGADGIIVSNHGGRLLDSAVAPADILPQIVDLVGHKLTVLADSGIRRGSDVVKLLALGAQAVLVGRAFLFGTVAGGAQGAADAMHMLKDEIERTMGYLGCRSIDEIGPDLLLSSFSNTVRNLIRRQSTAMIDA